MQCNLVEAMENEISSSKNGPSRPLICADFRRRNSMEHKMQSKLKLGVATLFKVD